MELQDPKGRAMFPAKLPSHTVSLPLQHILPAPASADESCVCWEAADTQNKLTISLSDGVQPDTQNNLRTPYLMAYSQILKTNLRSPYLMAYSQILKKK